MKGMNLKKSGIFLLAVFVSLIFCDYAKAASKGDSDVSIRIKVATQVGNEFYQALNYKPIITLKGKDKTILVIESYKINNLLVTNILYETPGQDSFPFFGKVRDLIVNAKFKKVHFVKQRYNVNEFAGEIWDVERGCQEGERVGDCGTIGKTYPSANNNVHRSGDRKNINDEDQVKDETKNKAGNTKINKPGDIAKMEKELAALDKQIAEMKGRLGTATATKDDSLDHILALAEQKEVQSRQLDALLKQRETEEQKHQQEIKRLKQEPLEKLAMQVEIDLAKYEKVASSKYASDMKDSAWKAMVANYPETKQVDVGDISKFLVTLELTRYEGKVVTIEHAMEKYNKAIALKPDENAYNNRGTAYSGLGQYQRAIEDYNKVIALNGGFSSVPYYNRGYAYYGLGQYKPAIDNFNESIRRKPDYTNAYLYRGNAYFYLGQYQRAIEDYINVNTQKPDYDSIYINLGNAYGGLRQHQRAIEYYNKAILLRPDYADAYFCRGDSYANLGQYQLSTVDYNKAIALDPINVHYRLRLSEMLIIMGKLDQAKETSDLVLQSAQSIAGRAIGNYLSAVSLRLQGKDTAKVDKELRMLCAEKFQATWPSKVFERWLKEARIPKTTKDYIQEITMLLKKHQ